MRHGVPECFRELSNSESLLVLDDLGTGNNRLLKYLSPKRYVGGVACIATLG